MQDQDAKSNSGAPPNDSIDLVAQTRSLRRKVIFWRRITWLLLSGVAIFAGILWQRGEQHRRACRTALAFYYAQAQKIKLAQQPPEVIETEWRDIKNPGELIYPHHYNLIVRNWRTQPAQGERLPLAICRDPHTILFWQRRHILYDNGQIEWVSENEAEPILQAAIRDDDR